MKCFIVSDVHSFYDEMIQALTEKGFDKNNPQHVFISLGDLLDRGNKPIECLKFVNSLDRKILIKGNHEDLMQEMIQRKCCLYHDVYNGTVSTASFLSNMIVKDETQEEMLEKVNNNELWKTYINSCIDFAETDRYIFVHGWIPYGDDWRSLPSKEWKYARWLNGMSKWKSTKNITEGKTIFCGHFHTSWGHCYLHNDGPEWDCGLDKAKFTTFKDKGIRALDACTAYSRFVNCEVVNVSKIQLKKYINL